MFRRSKLDEVQQTQVEPSVLPLDRRDALPRRAAASHSFAQTFGLDFRSALLTLIVDAMVFGGDAISMGLLIPLGVVVAGILGLIVYRIQTRLYGDDHDSALTKALIVGLLTAIPVPLAPVIAIPTGIVGIVKAIMRK